MDQNSKKDYSDQEGSGSFLPDGYDVNLANDETERDPYQAEILNEIRAGISKITSLEVTILQPGRPVPGKPYAFDLFAIAQSGKKSDVLDFLGSWLKEITGKIEDSMYFTGKHVLYEEYFDPDSKYESIEWEEFPRKHQKFIICIELREWLNKLIIGLKAENAPPGLGQPSIQLPSGLMPLFQISKRGGKINAIRILDAWYGLKMIENPNGQLPTKDEFMKGMGGVLGLDMTNYEQGLSQSYNKSIDSHLQLFDKLKEIAEEEYGKRLNKK